MFIHFFPRKSLRLLDNVEKYDRDRQATYNNIIRRMRTACCIPNATNARSQYVIIIAFPQQQWLRDPPLCYVIDTLPVFLINF
jgi:hypothetical protein